MVPPRLRSSDFAFHSLVLHDPSSRAKGLSATFATSFFSHAVLVAVFLIVPILLSDAIPEPGASVKAFFVAPVDIAPPPPPPPPPPAAAARIVRPTAVVPRPLESVKFVAPIEVPDQIKPELDSLDLGVEGGVPGGVEGGVPGGVVGGVIGGLPSAPPPPTRVVRVGGAIVVPKLLKKIPPEYPLLATSARIQGIVIIEAQVDVNGRVKTATVLRGVTLLDEAALAAVRQWVYKPLLLNGQPTEFILTVTVVFNLMSPGQP
jgi:protein TonB